eukprot:COSAG02_NODE_23928_length_703_cov_1.501247_1_plen_92_part_10
MTVDPHPTHTHLCSEHSSQHLLAFQPTKSQQRIRLDSIYAVAVQVETGTNTSALRSLGEVAVRVPEEALPEVEETATPFGLTPEQILQNEIR